MFKSSLFAAAALFTLGMAGTPALAQTAPGPYVLHVDLIIVPADLPKYLQLLKGHATATLQEPGNIEFNVAQYPGSPNHLVLFEVYKDEAAMNAHSNSDHFKKFMALTKDMVSDHLAQPLTAVEIHSKTH